MNDLESFLDEHRQRERVPGLAVAVVLGDRPVFAAACGTADLVRAAPFTVDTACHWFSMTKIATVTAAMRLVDSGDLDLDARVRDCVPDLLPPAFDGVRVGHLAQHAAGFRNPLPLRWVHPAGRPIPDQRAFLARHLRPRSKPRFEPGTRASYSNLSTVVLGEVLATVTGQSYVDHVRAAVLSPLALTQTGFTYAEVGGAPRAVGYQRGPSAIDPVLRAFLPRGVVGRRRGDYLSLEPFEMDAPACSGLIGPVTEAARFLTVHTAENDLLSRSSAARMQQIDMRGKPYDLGLGWFQPVTARGAPWVEHFGGGGGFWNVLRVYPERALGVAVMGNTTHRWDVGAVADRIAAMRW
ncbi:MAG TPA: serine hydrolase domain-containing protein [Acidimicrobiia bacterium]|nr:serine hydrolase domain-containing protein [Acidimicrobiia bacterium]